MKPSTTRSERRRSRQRQRLIDAARRIIAKKGLSGLTVQDVTEEADMAVGSFYTYFPSKEALLEGAIWEDLQRLGDPDNPLVQGMAIEERRQAQLFQVFKFVEDHRDLMAAVFGPGGSPQQFERALALIESRTAEGLRRTTGLPEEAIHWITPLLGGMIAGGIRYLLAHPEATAAELTLRTISLLRPMAEGIPATDVEPGG
jgi:AcrR family transcriptional regulator